MSSAGSDIRPVRLSEVGPEASEKLTAIHAEAFAGYWNPNDFNDFFSVPGTRAVLAEGARGEGPAGMVVLRVAGGQADIITIAIRRAWRRQGLGRSLMRMAVEMAREQGADVMFLDVEDGNTAALALYEGLGFTRLSRRRLYYRQKDGSYTDALVMTRKLA